MFLKECLPFDLWASARAGIPIVISHSSSQLLAMQVVTDSYVFGVNVKMISRICSKCWIVLRRNMKQQRYTEKMTSYKLIVEEGTEHQPIFEGACAVKFSKEYAIGFALVLLSQCG